METGEVAKSIEGEKLYQKRARKALPILVRQALAHQPIFYSDLANELDMPNPRNLNYVLGSIGQTLQEISDEWSVVRATQEMIRANIVFSFVGGGYTSPKFRNLTYSICLLFAFSVLEHVLLQFRDEGIFKCKSRQVGALMESSKDSVLSWENYDLVDEARERRNDIAHRRDWIEVSECLKYLDAIETELIAWEIIPSSSSPART